MFKKLEKYSSELEKKVKLRTQALDVEKQKTESLLAQMLPKSVAKSLLSGKAVDPESYEEVRISCHEWESSSSSCIKYFFQI